MVPCCHSLYRDQTRQAAALERVPFIASTQSLKATSVAVPASDVSEAGTGSSQSSESGESFDPGPQGVEDTRADGFAAATATEAAGRGKD